MSIRRINVSLFTIKGEADKCLLFDNEHDFLMTSSGLLKVILIHIFHK